MRRTVAVIGSSECTRSLALLLMLRDDAHVMLAGEDADGLRAAARSLGVEPRVEGPVPVQDLTAADVVVLCEGQAPPVDELRARCPDALLVIATTAPAMDGPALQERLLWPRQRVIGVDVLSAAGPPVERASAAARIVDHVLADRGRTLEATVQVSARGGADAWATVPVRIGGVGLQAIDVPPVRSAAAAAAG